jgi:hypothetical protein
MEERLARRGGFPGWVMGLMDAGLAGHPTVEMRAESYGKKSLQWVEAK